MNFFLLLTDAFSCFLYGIVVTAVIMVILYFVLKTLSQGIVRTPVFYITGVVLAVLLLIQTSLMIGAIQAKDAVDSALIYMNQLLENYSGIVGANDSQQILDAVTEEFPIIGVYLNLADFSGNAVSDLAESIHETMSDYLNSYIWHRVWWILGMIVVACVIVMLFDKRSPATNKPVRSTKMASRKNYDDF
ncbi:MAG: hypothetical protein ACI3YI_13580 [Bacteroidaceae bacterium]